MKKLLSVSLLVAAAVVIVVLASGVLPQNSSAETQPAAPALASAASAAPVVAEIPAKAVVPPPSIPTASPLAQIVRLTQANVDQGIIMTCVTNSSGAFNLDADRIIYLTDLGVPNTLINAMMQRDQVLQQQFAATQAAQQAPPPQPAPVSQSAPPVTTEVAAQPEPQPAPVTINYFYDTLSPYGSWVTVAGYGRCWLPTAVAYNPGWQPYCDNGNWVYTDCGWYWNSSYAWGATFHYGRWFLAAGQGWCWYPDTVWAPSWVTWRYSDNYCGWAPLPPRTYCQPGVGIVYQGGGVSAEFGFGLAASCFTFVPVQHFCDTHPRNYCAAPAQVTQIYNQTKVINNIKIKGDNNNVVVNNGIPVQNVAATTQTQIRPVPVHEIDRSFARDGHKQLSGSSPAQFGGVNRPNPTGNAGSTAPPAAPTRTPTSTATAGQNPARPADMWGNGSHGPEQSQFPPPAANQTPQANQTAPAPQTGQQFSRARNQTDRSQTTAPVSQSPAPATPVQTPPSNYNPLPATAHWPQPETPRNYGHNAEGRQNAVVQNPVVAPPANYSAPQPAPQPRQQIFNQPRNDVRQNYSQPAFNANMTPQQNAPVQPSSQGGSGRSQSWGAR